MKKGLLFSLLFTAGALHAQNVGIGTTTPTYKLEIEGGNRPLKITGGGSTFTKMQVDVEAPGDAILRLYDHNRVEDFRFATNGDSWLSGDGNIGIGTTTPSSKLHVQGTARVTSLAGTGTRMVVADANGELSTQAIPTGDITQVIAGNGMTGGGTSGVVTVNAVGRNGLSSTADDIRLGGTLIQNTTITQGAYGMTYNLNGSGDFAIQDAGVTKFLVNDIGNSHFGGDVYFRDVNTSGVNLVRIYDAGSGDDGTLDIYRDNIVHHRIPANGTVIFNDRSFDQDFRVESNGNSTMLFVDGGTNRVGIGTSVPTSTLDINGTVRIRGGGAVVGSVLTATSTNGTATWSNAGYGQVPIGTIVAWHKNASGVSTTLPAGWVECNGGTSNGITIPNLNGGTTSKSGDASRGRFLRGSTTSGSFQTDQSNNLYSVHHDDVGSSTVNATINDDGTTHTLRAYNMNGDRIQYRLEGVETRVTNMSVVWIMRVQ